MGNCVSDQNSKPYNIKSMRGRYHAGGKVQFKKKVKEKSTPMKDV